MKRITLLVASLFLIGGFAHANENIYGKRDGLTKRYRYAKPIKFVERGVEFHIFPNGEIDFNLNNAFRYNTNRRKSVNVIYKRERSRYRSSYSYKKPRVEYDYRGRVIKVGHTYINYNRYGKVRKVGSVYVDYNYNGLVSNIGGLCISYDRWGNVAYLDGYVHQNDYRHGYDHDFYYKKRKKHYKYY
ncbi:hypothetical protein GTQ40_05770 [Flavobacteriaceae bacterium R38]|nr:hypothetical protein [Flavobacteriaceae bacterium R38]